MTGRVLTQPELCELPPSVLLLLPPPLSLSLSRLPPSLCPSSLGVVVPFLAACSSSFLEEESFGTTYPTRVSCDAYASDSHSDGFSSLFFFRRPKGENKGILRARCDRARGESRYTFKVRTHTRGILYAARPKKEEKSLGEASRCLRRNAGKGNGRGRVRQHPRKFRRFAESVFPSL